MMRTIRRALYIIFALVALIYFGGQACSPQTNDEPTSDEKPAKERPVKEKPEKKKPKKDSSAKEKKDSKAKKKSLSKKSLKKLKGLSVAVEARSGYERDAFQHWSDLDGNGCDAREDVLARENLKPKSKVCYVLADEGVWFSVYDGEKTTDSGSFDVDHMVPLAEAWDSGANDWSAGKREEYANDLKHGTLIAVTAASNRSKSDQDPAEWLPPLEEAHCRYAFTWIRVKSAWELSVDRAEKKALKGIVKSCSNKELRSWPD